MDEDLTKGLLNRIEQLEKEREQLSRKCSENEKHYRRLVETAKVIAWESDLATGQFTYVSPQVEDVLGYRVEQWYTHNFWPKHIHPDDRDYALRYCVENSKLKKDYDFEYRMISKEGKAIWLHDIVSVITRSDGSKALSGYMLDITERKNAENILKENKEAAERANLAKTQFLANMSHEIRTPIAAVLGFIDMLKNPNNTEAESANYISIIERNSQQLLRLIDDILDLSKIEAEKVEIEKTNFSFPKFLSDFYSCMELKAKEKGLEFEIFLEGLIPEIISTDQLRLRQILANLVGNSIKFTEKGRVEIHVAFESPFLKFSISDTGCGISSHQVEKLFQPFSQADPSTTRKYGGTGLGLVLSKRISHVLGGDIELKWSEEGKGSTFVAKVEIGSVSQPRVLNFNEYRNAKAPHWREGLKNQLKGLKVLITEDSPDNRMLILNYLKETGAQLSTAEDGAEGVRKALSENPDVVLMDIQMPQMDGNEAIRRLRQSGFSKPIIALTAHAMREEREKCFDSGCTDYLTKPIRRFHLIEVLTHYLDTNQ